MADGPTVSVVAAVSMVKTEAKNLYVSHFTIKSETTHQSPSILELSLLSVGNYLLKDLRLRRTVQSRVYGRWKIEP